MQGLCDEVWDGSRNGVEMTQFLEMLCAFGAGFEEVCISNVQGAGFKGLVDVRGCVRLHFGEVVAYVGCVDAGDDS
jgi:hypothetical protein